MVPTESDGALEKKVKKIIDDELLKAQFDGMCQRICLKVIGKVQEIDEDHKEIKNLYNGIGERIDLLLADYTNTEENAVDSKEKSQRDVTGKSVIVIDDDDEEDNNRTNLKDRKDVKTENSFAEDKQDKTTMSSADGSNKAVATMSPFKPTNITSGAISETMSPSKPTNITFGAISATMSQSKPTIITSGAISATKKLEDVISKLTSKKVGRTSSSLSTANIKTGAESTLICSPKRATIENDSSTVTTSISNVVSSSISQTQTVSSSTNSAEVDLKIDPVGDDKSLDKIINKLGGESNISNKVDDCNTVNDDETLGSDQILVKEKDDTQHDDSPSCESEHEKTETAFKSDSVDKDLGKLVDEIIEPISLKTPEKHLKNSPISTSPVRRIQDEPPSLIQSPVHIGICNDSPNDHPPELTAISPKSICRDDDGERELSNLDPSKELSITTDTLKNTSNSSIFTETTNTLTPSPLSLDYSLTEVEQDLATPISETAITTIDKKQSGFDVIRTVALIKNGNEYKTKTCGEEIENKKSSEKLSSKTFEVTVKSPVLAYPSLPPRLKAFSFSKNRVVFAKPTKSDIWFQAKLLQENSKKRTVTSYLVGFLSGQKPQQRVDTKCIATREHCHPADIELGTRIVAGRPSDTVNSTVQKKYKDISSATTYTVMFSGTIAELACEANRFRYLVFFDDGYAQYLPLNKIFPVISSSKEVWNDVSIDCQEFIKEYLQEYPFRPLVFTKIGCTMQTEWNGQWWHSRVVSVDSSLVKILFDFDKRSEWIYRGTTRLEPMYNHFIQPQPKASKGRRGRKSATVKVNKDESYVDETITDPQYGICKYSLTDPQGINQIAKWGKPKKNTNQILTKCQEESTSVALKSPRIVSPPPLPVEIITIDKTRFPSLKKAKRSSSTLTSPRSTSSSKASTRTTSPSVTPPLQRNKKVKVEVTDSQSDTPEPEFLLGKSLDEPVITKEEKSPVITKEEISQEDLLGALTALNTSFGDNNTSKLTSPLGINRRERHSLDTDKSSDQAKQYTPSPTSTPTKTPLFPPPKKPVRHACNEKCIVDRRNLLETHRLGYTNYLAIPFQLGWKRESAKKLSSYHRDIYYRTPCNKRMRNLSEVTKYLVATKCDNVCIDMFCFHSKISCRSQSIKAKTPKEKIDDLSDGRETCPVVLVNEVTDELPPQFAYISSRNKAEDVYINIDPSFLVCCDCTDFCQDKSKCQCAQLTVESSNAIDGVKDHIAGYHYRRLKECFTTGIYECNSNCSCMSSCYNRVVQNGIQLRLQVFMTEDRGWGLQCIDDIPKGTFVCTYAGQVLNEHTANREGMDYGDEYLAEMDHIEVVEKAKDGYESDVPEFADKTFTIDSDSESFTESDSSDSVINISSDSDSDDIFCEPVTKRLKTVEETRETPADRPKEIEVSENKEIEVSQNKETESTSSVETTANSDESNIETESVPTAVQEDLSSQCQVTLRRIPSADLPRRNESLSEISKKEVSKKPGEFFVPLAKKSTCQVAFKNQNTSDVKLGQDKEKSKERVMSTRSLYNNDDQMYVIDAKSFGNVGRFMNHSCSPNLFVQNVLVDTHDLRFPWVAFFAQQNIPAYTELTWDYNYEVGSVPGKEMTCKCGSKTCKGRLL